MDDTDDPATLPPMELRKRAGIERRRFKKTEAGVLAQTILGALRIRSEMRAQGESQANADHYLEGVLREAWPKQRAEPWHYLCDRCRDTGLEIHQCTPSSRCNGISTRVDHWRDKPGKYQRLCVRDSSYTHDYGVPCVCARGDRFREHQRQQTDITSLGKRKSETRPTRFWE